MSHFNINIRSLILLQQLLHMQCRENEADEKMIEIFQKRSQRRKARPRRSWVRPWLNVGRRRQFGQFNRLMPELRHEDPASFINFLRISPEMFDELITRIGPRCTKRDTIELEMKIAITLRHLAAEYKNEVITCPSTPEEWKA